MTAWPDFGATHGETAHWRVEMSTLTGRVLVPCWDVWTCTEPLSRVLCGSYHCEYIFFLFSPLLFNLIKTQGISMTKEPFLREILFTSRPLNVSLRTFAHIKRWNYLGRSFDSVTVRTNSKKMSAVISWRENLFIRNPKIFVGKREECILK